MNVFVRKEHIVSDGTKPHPVPGQQPSAAAPRKAKRPPGPVAVEIRNPPPRAREGVPQPWYFAAPGLFRFGLDVAVLPLRVFAIVCEVVVSAVFAGFVGVVVAWYFKVIPDSDVSAFITGFSDRLQGILKGAGLF